MFLVLGYGLWQFGRSVPWLNVTTMDDEALKPLLDAMEEAGALSRIHICSALVEFFHESVAGTNRIGI